MTKKTPTVAIIGTGFAGLGMAIQLKRAGLDTFTVFESAPSLGGTWRDNTYPGAACDVPSLLYSFSFEPNPRWSRQYAPQAEILAYLQHCAEKYGLGPHLRFNTRVVGARFDEAAGQWTLALEGGGTARADVVVLGSGGLTRPSIPALPGLERFAGACFHSARWDHARDLTGLTVGVIGTGASAIQLVPQLAGRVKRLHVFQRTPPWVLPKEDGPITPRTRTLYRALPALQRWRRHAIYWRLESRAPLFSLMPGLLKAGSWLARRHLEASIPDPVLRAKLTPDYVLGCKRVLVSDDYYPALREPHVELVTEGIDEVLPEGPRTQDGRVRPVDVLILATGFQAAELGAPFPIQGRGGVDLDAAWRSGAEAFLGASVAGMPNLFFLGGPNSGLGHNSMVYMLEAQIAHVMDALRTLEREGLAALEVREEVQARFNRRIQERLDRAVWSTGGCRSWYTTRSGKNTTLWPGFTFEFRLRTRRLRAADYHRTPHRTPEGEDAPHASRD